MNEPLINLVRRAAGLARGGGRGVLCLVVKSAGSTPQAPGALMLVDETAGTYGTIGGGCVEAEVRRRAHGLLMAGRSGVLAFKLDHDYGWDDGLICGGTIHVAVGTIPEAAELEGVIADIEARRETALRLRVESEEGPDEEMVEFSLRLPPAPRLYIAGAGHVGQAVARLALGLEFDVTVFDDREDLLERFVPTGAAKAGGQIAARLAAAEMDGQTYAVIVTRGHKHDERALAAVVGRGARYVGMIGSRRKVKLIFDDLAAMGVAREELARVHAPIGLDIGSVTVEEIGVSIAAQLVSVRRAGKGAGTAMVVERCAAVKG